jgi:hypothetical protein
LIVEINDELQVPVVLSQITLTSDVVQSGFCVQNEFALLCAFTIPNVPVQTTQIAHKLNKTFLSVLFIFVNN